MSNHSAEPQPTFTVFDLLAGYIVCGLLGWLVGGVVGLALDRGWAAGAFIGLWTGFGLFTVLVIRTIWRAVQSLPCGPNPAEQAPETESRNDQPSR